MEPQSPGREPTSEFTNDYARALEQSGSQAERTEAVKSLSALFDAADALLQASDRQDEPFTDQLIDFAGWLDRYRAQLGEDIAALSVRSVLYMIADNLRQKAAAITGDRRQRFDDARTFTRFHGGAVIGQLAAAPTRQSVQSYGGDLIEVFGRGQKRMSMAVDSLDRQRRDTAAYVRNIDLHAPDELPADVREQAWQRTAALEAANRNVDERDGAMLNQLTDAGLDLRKRLETVAELTPPDEPTTGTEQKP